MMDQVRLKEVEDCLLAAKNILEKIQLMALSGGISDSKEKLNSSHIEVDDYGLRVGSVVIPLNNRPMTKKLVRAFLNASEQFLSRDEMLSFVYDVQLEGLSPRLKQSLHQNLNKLLSRSRSFLDNACHIARINGSMKWFVFDIHLQRWQLYTICGLGKDKLN